METKDDGKPIGETFPDEHLYILEGRIDIEPWYADIVNYLVTRELPRDMNLYYKNKLKYESKLYMWNHPYLWKIGQDKVIQRCIPESKVLGILAHCHSFSCGGHFRANRTARKILDIGFFWHTVFKDSSEWCKVDPLY